MVWRELALAISLVSLGSSQILRLPQPTTEAARRFCVRRLTLLDTSVSTVLAWCGVDGVEKDCAKRGSPLLEALWEQHRESGRAWDNRNCFSIDACVVCGRVPYIFDDVVDGGRG